MDNLRYRTSAKRARKDTSTQHLAAQPTMLTDIKVEFGPQDVFGRFFLLADYALRESGLNVHFGTFQDVLETNLANRDTWLPLLPTFHPHSGLEGPDRSYAMIGRNQQGKVVVVHGVCLFDWAESDFKTEAEHLRLFYKDPATMAVRGEECAVTAPSADRVRGRVTFSGAAWFHPSVRGKLTGAILSRVSRAYAYTRWQNDITSAIMARGLIQKGWAQQNGYPNAELGYTMRNFEFGNYDGGVVWIGADDIIDDIVRFKNDLEDRLGSVGRLRSA